MGTPMNFARQVPSCTHLILSLQQKSLILDIDECASDPCTNNGTCTDRINGFVCSCLPGYTGSTCKISKRYRSNNTELTKPPDIDECNPNPCQNGAVCEDLINDFYCPCLAGYTGKKCSVGKYRWHAAHKKN